MSSKRQSHGCYCYSQWWRRLVNAYEVKAGMMCLQCKNCVIHTWALQRRASHNGALYKSIFLYLHDTFPCRSDRQYLSNDDRLEDEREDYQNCSVLYYVAQMYTHMSTCYRWTRSWFRLIFCICFVCWSFHGTSYPVAAIYCHLLKVKARRQSKVFSHNK